MLFSHFCLWCYDLMEIEPHILYNVSLSSVFIMSILHICFHVDVVCLSVFNYIGEKILIDFIPTFCLMYCLNGTKDDSLNNMFEWFFIIKSIYKSLLWFCLDFCVIMTVWHSSFHTIYLSLPLFSLYITMFCFKNLSQHPSFKVLHNVPWNVIIFLFWTYFKKKKRVLHLGLN